MKLLRRILVTLLGIVVALVAAFAVYVASRQDLHFSAPAPHITASADSATVERGRYLVEDVVNCAKCHGDQARVADYEQGVPVDLVGGYVFDIPPGKFYPPNITPDVATGIGGVPDTTLARSLRYGIRRDGRVLLPFMEFQDLSDADLAAILSYLRSRPKVAHLVPAHVPNVLGRIVLATMLANPRGPSAPPPAVSPSGATLENGRYIVEHLAGCVGCHTVRDERNGNLVGPKLAGAKDAFQTAGHPMRHWSPRNITRAPNTGALARLSEDQFVARFRAGEVLPGSPMPWNHFKRMHEDDLRAVYRYLMTMPPIENDPGPVSFDTP
jgi:mono/diheme cytochrome c family protein